MPRNRRDELNELYIKGAQQFFPGLSFGSIFSLYNGDEPESGNFQFSNLSEALIGTPYGKVSPKYFIHYTSVVSVVNIINSATFRLFDLNNSNDPNEFIFAADYVNISLDEKEISSYKKNSFTASFCGYHPNSDDFNMWRLYGQNGNGAAIVFEILNYDQPWHNAYFGKVYYGHENDAFVKLKSFLQFHNSFQNQYKVLENVPSFLPLLALFHKTAIWSLEQEYRIIATCKYNVYDLDVHQESHSFFSQSLNYSIANFGQLTAYIDFPLNLNTKKSSLESSIGEDMGNEYFNKMPQLKIYEVLLGHNVTEIIYDSLSFLVDNFAHKKLDYSFPVKYSSIKSYFK